MTQTSYERGQRLVFTKRSSLNGPLYGEEGDVILFKGRAPSFIDRCLVSFEDKSKNIYDFYALYSEIRPYSIDYKQDQEADEDGDLL